MRRASALLCAFGMNDRTAVTKSSKWKCYVEYCNADGLDPLPSTEAHLLGYVGWLAEQRERNLRSVAHSSLPTYLSTVRTTHLQVLGEPMPAHPMVKHAVGAYKSWEETAFPAPSRRLGLSAAILKEIWTLGMQTVDLATLRDAAMVVFSYVMSGLRDSSVVSIESNLAALTAAKLQVQLSYVKGKPASRVAPVALHAADCGDRLMDLFLRWHRLRPVHTRYFALRGEPASWRPALLFNALMSSLRRVGHCAPPGCHYGAHSLRIGAHTVQVLLGLPLEARMARFGWGPHSESMTRLYFDRTIRLDDAAIWFFGGLRPPPMWS